MNLVFDQNRFDRTDIEAAFSEFDRLCAGQPASSGGRLLKGGRGQVAMIRIGAVPAVIRHYRRGGAVANISEDRFIWLGEKRCRSVAEWKILVRMRDMHLPVPAPIAARWQRSGATYTADIITEEVLGACTITEHLARGPMDQTEWQAVGEIIAEFHRAGVHHVDLTTDNILRRGVGNFVVIDFDKARFRLAGLWQGRSVARLLRGIRKRISAGKLQYFRESDLNAMLAGYQKGALKRRN